MSSLYIFVQDTGAEIQEDRGGWSGGPGKAAKSSTGEVSRCKSSMFRSYCIQLPAPASGECVLQARSGLTSISLEAGSSASAAADGDELKNLFFLFFCFLHLKLFFQWTKFCGSRSGGGSATLSPLHKCIYSRLAILACILLNVPTEFALTYCFLVVKIDSGIHAVLVKVRESTILDFVGCFSPIHLSHWRRQKETCYMDWGSIVVQV